MAASVVSRIRTRREEKGKGNEAHPQRPSIQHPHAQIAPAISQPLPILTNLKTRHRFLTDRPRLDQRPTLRVPQADKRLFGHLLLERFALFLVQRGGDERGGIDDGVEVGGGLGAAESAEGVGG